MFQLKRKRNIFVFQVLFSNPLLGRAEKEMVYLSVYLFKRDLKHFLSQDTNHNNPK